MTRYDYRSLEPYQALITINANGDYGVYYTRDTDPLIASFLNLRRCLSHPPHLPLILKLPSVRSIYNHLPFAPNLSTPEYVPTRMMSLLRKHPLPPTPTAPLGLQLLPDWIPDVNAPVAQVWVRGSAVACSTLFVHLGLFNIFPDAL